MRAPSYVSRRLDSATAWSQLVLNNWRDDQGRLKDIAARARLRKLDAAELIRLPARRKGGSREPPEGRIGCAGWALRWTCRSRRGFLGRSRSSCRFKRNWRKGSTGSFSSRCLSAFAISGIQRRLERASATLCGTAGRGRGRLLPDGCGCMALRGTGPLDRPNGGGAAGVGCEPAAVPGFRRGP